MKTVRSILGLRKQEGEIGIEVEVEGYNLIRGGVKHWRVENDGSLRGESAEYVLSKPVPREMVRPVVEGLWKAVAGYGGEFHDTVRAGVHVHINCQELTPVQVFTFVTAYLCLEQQLTNWCGDRRAGNLFCLNTSQADFFSEFVRRKLKDLAGNPARALASLENDTIRYCSINLKALPQYGSVEFRALGTEPEYANILQWVEILTGVKDKSLEFNNPQEVVKYFSEAGLEGFTKAFVPTLVAQGYKFDSQSAWEDVRNAMDIAFSINWEDVGKSRIINIGGINFEVEGRPEDIIEPEEDF